MSGAAFKLQQRRRDQERLLHETQSYLRQQHKTERLLDWEHRTNAQIQQRQVCNLTQQLLKEDDDELKKRQEELQKLYGGEMDKWKSRLKNKLEVTQEQRIEHIRKRAYTLKSKREAERKNFVKECYQRQWRDSCDDLRAIDSKNILDRLADDRMFMLETKKALTEHQNVGGECTGNSMSFLHDRDDGESHRREINLRTKQALDQQIKWKREQQAFLVDKQTREEEEQLRHLAHLEEKSRENQKELVAKARKEGEDMYQQMLERSKLREERRKLESDHDSILLRHALEKEIADIEMEKAKKEEGKEAAFEYVQCLREQLREEIAERQQTNAIRDAASEAIFKKNDERLAAEAELRRQWAEEVKISRQEQIKMRQEEIDRLRREEELEVLENRAAQFREEEIERQKEEQSKAHRIENTEANKAIMEKMARDREMEQREKYLLNKQIQFEEKIHQERLERFKRTR